MVKVALLIGISQYQPDLAPLPGVEEDIKAMQRVLQNPNICGFDEVKTLLNCDRQNIAEEIEQLFSHRGKNDLVLLYFSGHGIKDESGELYFATSITRKDGQGKLRKATALEASVVQKIMSNSRSKRQVVILDCCFSGAFAQGMQGKDNGVVDIENQLGGEGRAVLTSSTSTQYSLDSIYTRYIVEGLETGLADIDNDGKISVEELHEYTKQQVQEAAPAMKPEIYPIKEGFNIILAQVRNNPELIYRKTVERLCAKGEISDIGRRILNAQQDSLGLPTVRAKEIEEEFLLPFRTRRNNSYEYEEAYREAVRSKNPISEHTRNELKELQQILGLRDEDISRIEATINAPAQSLTAPAIIVNSSHHQNNNLLKYLGICIIGAVIGASVGYFVRPPIQTCANKEQYILKDRISLGEEVLLQQVKNSDKQAGVQAFEKGDCLTAITKFQAYRAANISDPEALIYLNNAQARLQGNGLKIAVSVPIGTNPNVAQEMLRGVAQAQNEVNNSGGINGKALQVVIANDDNNPSIASNIATQFVNDDSILAVVGHNASNVSIAAAQVYERGELVMMSPTSFSSKLIGSGNYVFLTAPSSSSIVEEISNYAIKKARKNNFLICIDSQARDNLSFHEEFINVIKAVGAKINPIICDVSAPNFNPEAVISQAKKNGANGMLLALYIDRIKEGLAVTRANQGQLAVFSSSTLYTDETLKAGNALAGLVIAIPWHPKVSSNHPFAKNTMELWKARVNWRTATSYDATQAIIKGLQQSQNKTRKELQNTLHSPNFSFDGATGKIQFLPSGDRTENSMFLVQVKLTSGPDKYDFVPIPIKLQ